MRCGYGNVYSSDLMYSDGVALSFVVDHSSGKVTSRVAWVRRGELWRRDGDETLGSVARSDGTVD